MTLQELIADRGGTAEQTAKLVEGLKVHLGCETVSQFLAYFSNTVMMEWFKDVGQTDPTWLRNAPLFCIADASFHAAKAVNEKQKKLDADIVDDLEDKTPLDPETNRTLTAAWKAAYRYNIHPSQEYNSQLLHNMYKKLRTRRGGAEIVKGLYTLQDQGTQSIKKRRHEFSMQFDLIDKSQPADKDDHHFYANKAPWLYMVAQESMLRTFTKAGTYLVPNPMKGGKEEFMVEREPIEEHLAHCRAFIIDWSNRSRKPPDHVIIRQIARIDINIRKKWWRKYVEDDPPGRTFTSCILDSEHYAEQQWDQDFELLMFPGGAVPKHYQGEDRDDTDWDGYDTPKKKKKNKKGKGKGKGTKGGKTTKGGKGAMGNAIAKMSMWLGDKKVSCARTNGTTNFCGQFNSKGTCKNGDACNFIHKCSILTAAKKTCGGNHAACNHTGKTITE